MSEIEIEIEIEKNVPAPNQRGKGRPKKYPWAKMQPGDSFFLVGARVAPMGSVAKWKIEHPEQKFVTRKESDGIRVWRIA